MEKREVVQHGVEGAYVGGSWVDIEDCPTQFNVKDGSCGNNCEACPRSRSRTQAAKSDGSYDVVIIGAGCIGASIARELSKYQISTLVLESADDITQGATKGNSGIVHAGFDDTPGTNRAKYCWPGNQMFAQLDKELHFGYQKNGSIVVASTPEEEVHLEELKARGEKNGVQRLRILDKKELFKLEPYLNPEATKGLLSPDAGNVIPYEFAIALMENAVDNGVECRIRREVQAIKKHGDHYTVTARYWEPKQYLDAVVRGPNLFGLVPLLVQILAALLLSFGLVRMAAMPGKIGQAVAPLLQRVVIATNKLTAGNANTAAPGVTSFEDPVLMGSLLLSTLLFVHAMAQICMRSTHARSVGATVNDFVRAVASAGMPIGSGGSKVTTPQMALGGSGCADVMKGETVAIEQIRTKFVINCAGAYADKIANMIGDHSFKIKPRLGDYMLLKREQGYLASHTLFPCPSKLGKGVLVQTTLWGNLILGPTARDVHDPAMMNQTDEDVQEFIFAKCNTLVPHFDASMTIHSFAGARAKSDRGDWIIEWSTADKDKTFLHVAGIDSPGLAGSPAIALDVIKMLQQAGLALKKNPAFNPNRAPIIVPKDSGMTGLRAGPVGKVTNPEQNVVCKCEKVTEQEVVTALRRNLPVDSTQAIRKRTRAGMGYCQADKDNYNCECRVAAIIARENKIPVEAVTRRPWPATSSLPQRWISDAQKKSLAVLQAK